MRRRKIRAASQAYRYGLGFDILSVSYHNVYLFFSSLPCSGKMSDYRKETVVIIGGGIIGLTTAYELIKKFNVHLVEKR